MARRRLRLIQAGLGRWGRSWAAGEVDAEAVLIVTPPDTHRGVATLALRAGKHVVVEKPLAPTLADRRLVDEAARRERVLVVSQNYRFHPPEAVRRLVAGGSIGPLVHVGITCRRDLRGRPWGGHFGGRLEYPYLLDMAVHHFDVLRAVSGAEVSDVYVRSWHAALATGEPAEPSGEENLRSLAVVFAAIESARRGRVVRIEPRERTARA